MPGRQYTQFETTGLYKCGECGSPVWSPEQHDQWHARRLLRAVSGYIEKEIARRMSY